MKHKHKPRPLHGQGRGRRIRAAKERRWHCGRDSVWIPKGVCRCCEAVGVIRYRQGTFYANEESNWVTMCLECAKENNRHWDDMWQEYDAMRR